MRLVSPAGTVVECDGDLAEKLKKAGWTVDEAEKPKAKRPKKK